MRPVRVATSLGRAKVHNWNTQEQGTGTPMKLRIFTAAHAIPPVLSMGQSLPLVTPRIERAAEPAPPRETEQPKPSSPADAVQEGVKALRGILRF